MNKAKNEATNLSKEINKTENGKSKKSSGIPLGVLIGSPIMLIVGILMQDRFFIIGGSIFVGLCLLLLIYKIIFEK